VTDVQSSPQELLKAIFTSAELRADPYPAYRALRAQAPVYHSPDTGIWYLSAYEATKAVLRDPRFGRGTRLREAAPGGFADQQAQLRRRELTSSARNMLFADPPEHTRLRSLVSRAFTPKRVEGLRSEIARLLEPLLEDVARAGVVDVVDGLAFPLPVAVIGALVGVPEADRPRFRSLVRASTAIIESVPSVESLAQAEEAVAEMGEYFQDLAAQRRLDPTDDLLSAMLAVEDGGDRLCEEEVVATAVLLFAAGFETTTNLIANAIYCLLRFPSELRRLREDPDLVPSAVEEVLRFESPVQIDGRCALVPASLEGVEVGTGTVAVTLLGAANRDERVYSEPETFDVGRFAPGSGQPVPLSFGWGIHHCLGAHLARAEGEIVVSGLLRRFSHMALSGPEPEWRAGLTLRGLEHLNVRFVAR